MILLIDNYDSFTWNLVHFLGDLGAQVVVKRNDALSVDAALGMGAEAIVLSPGPCTPNEAGICLDLVRAAPPQLPILGVCLGHQAIGQAYGGMITGAPQIMHGKISEITHDGTGVLAGLPSPFKATRYHSLAVNPAGLSADIIPIAWTADGTIMAVRHAHRPIHGVQFHPESIATEHGHALLRNFLGETALHHAA
ncbi:MAG: aminodeoxychorismate/anthranilate synthase component II [Rhodospirillaceae bacterium]|nr:aminodeoxychorismate/anthranilate synthase component II [Rhodospirillaceae bacterium]